MTEYPNGACEKHGDAKTSEPVCLVCMMEEIQRFRSAHEAAQAEIAALREAIKASRLAIGEHNAPGDCYSTGPLTGDPIRDLVICPACVAIALCDAAIDAARKTK